MKTLILGAGITGLSAGYASGLPIYEAANIPGGICTSYYMRPHSKERLHEPPKDGEAYHFEIGGGHWIFGGDPAISEFIMRHSPCTRYSRKASVYLKEWKSFVPYPIQNHLAFLPKDIAAKALNEMLHGEKRSSKHLTMAEWMKLNFGKTLSKLFFDPFHELYTAHLYKKISPQDAHKSPIDRASILKGLKGEASAVGYNTTFLYPDAGLNDLMKKLSSASNVKYGKKIVRIDTKNKNIIFADGVKESYSELVSTLPLHKVIKMCGLQNKCGEPHPSSSVLVINIGAKKGPSCPSDHWIYMPVSESGFHRVGFYSNVNKSFLPNSARKSGDKVSIYVETAFPEDKKLNKKFIDNFCKKTIKELQDLGWIKEVEVFDPTWIETAYTWSWPDSPWRENALKTLEEKGIFQIGRYGRWHFQGVADSIKDGLTIGAAFS